MNKKPRKKVHGFHTRKTELDESETETRGCLRCGKEFLSMHKFNKICPRCALVNNKY
jgi:ribosomal protein S27AE